MVKLYETASRMTTMYIHSMNESVCCIALNNRRVCACVCVHGHEYEFDSICPIWPMPINAHILHTPSLIQMCFFSCLVVIVVVSAGERVCVWFFFYLNSDIQDMARADISLFFLLKLHVDWRLPFLW